MLMSILFLYNLGTLKAFDDHYSGKRQPFGIYVHPSKLKISR